VLKLEKRHPRLLGGCLLHFSLTITR
jgi:hypothetical protein